MILSDESVAKIKEKASHYPEQKSAILPALTVAYEQVGYVDETIYREIARVIKIPYIEIAEAATFYTMFSKNPRGKYRIMACHNISCALRGADSMIKYLEEKLGLSLGETTPDNLFTLESMECLGSCSTAPMLQINDDFHENLTREKVDTLIDQLKGQD